jgi:hemerythrin-like domain-containing protein
MTQPIRLTDLTAAPAAGFEQPFAMLEACHERVHRMLALLARLREHLRMHGADDQARQAARDVMRYFDQAAPQHHRDEELHVFPPLLARGDAATVAVVQRLQADHVRMESGWAAAREVLQGVVEGRAPVGAQEAALAGFAGLYDQHIVDEEKIVYPAAQAVLDAAEVQAIGEEMMRRRGVR